MTMLMHRKPYCRLLRVTFVGHCGCWEREYEDDNYDELIMGVCPKHAERIKEIVARRKPLPGKPIPVHEDPA